jgi:hypothetical protein
MGRLQASKFYGGLVRFTKKSARLHRSTAPEEGLMTNIENEEEVEEFVRHADAQIDMLNNRLRDLGPQLKKECGAEISNLILSREAVRRGLLQVTDYGESCSSCPLHQD